MRLLILTMGLLCLAGCAGQRRVAPTAEPVALIAVFADDFHSGVMLARRDAPPELLPGTMRPWSWAVFHFGERRWIRGEADGVVDALRLAVMPGDGGMQVDLVPSWTHDRGGSRIDRQRLWLFQVSAAELAGAVGRLRAWKAADGLWEQLGPTTCWHPASRKWSVWDNCHDFTVDILAGAGITLDGPPIRMAGGLRAALDEAWDARQRP